MLSSYIIVMVILVRKCYFVLLEQLMFHTLMLGNECMRNSFKINNINDFICLSPATGHVVILLLSVGVPRVLLEIKPNTDVYKSMMVS